MTNDNLPYPLAVHIAHAAGRQLALTAWNGLTPLTNIHLSAEHVLELIHEAQSTLTAAAQKMRISIQLRDELDHQAPGLFDGCYDPNSAVTALMEIDKNQTWIIG